MLHEGDLSVQKARAPPRSESPPLALGSAEPDSVPCFLPAADDIKPCPRCSAYIIKMNDGSCNHMTCAVCGCEFCWLCMKEISDLHYLRWGPEQGAGLPSMTGDVWLRAAHPLVSTVSKILFFLTQRSELSSHTTAGRGSSSPKKKNLLLICCI